MFSINNLDIYYYPSPQHIAKDKIPPADDPITLDIFIPPIYLRIAFMAPI